MDKLAYSKIRAETCKIMPFPPEIISITKLLRHYIIQTLVVLGNVIDVASVANGLEKNMTTNIIPCVSENTENIRFISELGFSYSQFS